MKYYKCGYTHCAHKNKEVAQDEAVKVGKRYWHKDCCEISDTIKEIRCLYLNKISASAVGSYLNKVINDIVFGKKLENNKVPKTQSNLEAARYLLFSIKYAVAHKIPITHVAGLYYLIDNIRIKKAYKEENELKIQKELKKEMEQKAEKPVDTTIKANIEFTKTPKRQTFGFGSILKGVSTNE